MVNSAALCLHCRQTNKNVHCHALDEVCHILLNQYPEDSGVQDGNQKEILYWGYSKKGRYFSDSRIYFSNLNWMRIRALVLLTLEKGTYFVSVALINLGLCWRLKILWKKFRQINAHIQLFI